MSSINSVSLTGRLVRDPETRSTNTGKSVTSLTLAVDGYSDQVSFINCVLWNKTGEIAQQYLQKGSLAGVTGRISQRTYEDKSGNKRDAVEVVVDSLALLGSKSDNERNNAPMTQAQALNGGKDVVVQDIDDKPIDLSEIPF